MKIKNGFVLEPVGGAYIAIAVGKETNNSNALIRMNSSGAFLWNLLSEGEHTEKSLLDAMLAEYDVSEEIAARDIAAFIKKLSDAGLLEQ
ncbi:MAG: PqqD family protein [Clostridia bacterium]|nr:PqqD family protein [Clostridia bacterium]MBR3680401.1 PqqD family protein [Clostridia bacterium]